MTLVSTGAGSTASVGMMESTWICLNLVPRDFEGFVTLQVDRFQDTCVRDAASSTDYVYAPRRIASCVQTSKIARTIKSR